MSKNTFIPFLVSLLFVAALAATLYMLLGDNKGLPLPPELQSSVMSQPRPLEPFALADQDGHAFTLNELKGHWTFLFFGYTHCPDVCPTTLGTLQGVAKQLGAENDDSRFVFISVDPKRDSPAHLKEYLHYFNPAFIGVTGERDAIDNLARQVGVVYFFEGDTEGSDYIVNHTATVLLIDPQGRLYARFNPPHSVKGMVDTFHRVRDYYGH